MWSGFVELIRAGIFSAAHVCGGSLGGGVLVVSFLVRLGLLPLTLRLARRARDQQRRLALAQRDIERIQRRYAKDPTRLLRETKAVYRIHGISMWHPQTVIGVLVQAPLLAGLFGAVRTGLGRGIRFAWIGDLAGPNALLAGAVAALTAAGVSIAPPASASSSTAVPAVIAGVLTLVFLWSASSTVALSWGSGAVVSLVQNAILAREGKARRPRV